MTDPNERPVSPPPAYQQNAYQPTAYQQNAPAYAPNAGYGQPAAERYNVLAIVSLVSAFVISLVAVITGHIALSQIKKTGEKGRGLAIAGLVLGYLGMVAGLLITVLFLVAIANNPGAYTRTP